MKKLSRFIGRLVVLFFILSVGGVVLFRFLPVPFTPLMGIRTVESLSSGEPPQLHHQWVPHDKLTAAQAALIAATLPNPLVYSSKEPSAYMKKRQAHILRQMRTVHLQEERESR